MFYHIVFSIKQRQKPLKKEQMKRMREYIAGVIRNLKAKLYVCNGPEDHVHLLASLHPDMSVSDFVRLIKTNSSKWFRQTVCDDFSWQDGYSAFSVSYSGVKQISEYTNQYIV
ncbi:MAG: IS200/IS605 family transposase [Sedimentisphaerales bacterium]|nr:IS200/IS605 family transposase [Sedimentisphaerales bacterium]